jgi:hypothetical protein
MEAFLVNREERKEAQRKGKKDGRLCYSFSFRISSSVPTSPEL